MGSTLTLQQRLQHSALVQLSGDSGSALPGLTLHSPGPMLSLGSAKQERAIWLLEEGKSSAPENRSSRSLIGRNF